ncbi:unnamed protein product [Pocillopora meandrina]|uniref:GIY-YIG endonuclease n=1 Tax=Pocillopora meandrina TaxID=46732 RepID=A0AAU9XQZ2_9CNID|nr:unnamed protein product [Pocillopora meandrina]
MAIQKIFSVTAKNQLQIVTLLMKGNQATGFAVIPYIQGVTEPIKRILNSHNVKVAQKPFQTLGHIFAKPKDPFTKEQRTDAIYSIPCNDCDNEYIGQTKRQFGTRLKEHQKALYEMIENRNEGLQVPENYLEVFTESPTTQPEVLAPTQAEIEKSYFTKANAKESLFAEHGTSVC